MGGSDGNSPVLRELDSILATDITFIVLTLVFFSARITVRMRYFKRFGRDDWTMCAAMASYMVTIILDVDQNRKIKQMYSGQRSLSYLPKILLGAQVESFFYSFTIVFAKLSFGLFFLNLFVRSQTWQRQLIIVSSGLVATCGAAWAILAVSTCAIPSFVTSSRGRNCRYTRPFMSFSIVCCVVNAMAGLVLTGLSLYTLQRIPLRRMLKASAMVLVAVAAIGSIISLVRIKQIVVYDSDEIGRWGLVEAGIYIITGCLITLRPLLFEIWMLAAGPSHSGTSVTGSVVPLHLVHSETKDSDLLGGEIRKTTTIQIHEPEDDELARSRDLHYYWLFGPLQHDHSKGWVGNAPPPN